MAYEAEAKNFLKQYYDTFDTSRDQLHAFYEGNSMLTFGRDQVAGQAAIAEKFKNLPFTEQVKHVWDDGHDVSVQPSAEDGILIVVTGQVQEFGQPAPLNFVEVFQLKMGGNSGRGFYIFNDVFKLV